MAKSYHQKMKLLYLMKLFWEETDEQHVVSMKEMIEYLEKKKLRAERKSIYDDIEALKAFGMDIKNRREKPAGYYLDNRMLNMQDCKLIMTAVQSSPWPTGRKAKELVQKTASLCSRWNEPGSERQMYVIDRVKSMNESLYQNLEIFYEAIKRDVQVSFRYMTWKIGHNTQIRKTGKTCLISPWAVCKVGEEYYIIGYEAQKQRIKHYPVIKMAYIKLLEEKREGKESFEKLDLELFYERCFGEPGSPKTRVKFYMENHLLDGIMDQFGKDVWIRPEGDRHFIAIINVDVNERFFGWLSGLGMGARLLEPECVVRQYQEFLQRLLTQYQ